jgi:heavy metal sensor kinase
VTARLPIRWKLTIWYAALMAATLILFGIALFAGMRTVLYDSFDEQVHNQAALALAAVRTDEGPLDIDPSAVASLNDEEHFVRLIASDGQIVVDTGQQFANGSIDPGAIADARDGATRAGTFDLGEKTMRVVTTPVRAQGQILGVLQVGASREDPDEVLGLLLIALGIAAPIMLLLAAGGGYLLSGRALAPVASITALAGSIGGGDLHARLALDLPDDELGQLAHTFDGMLVRIEDAFERQRRFTGDAAHELRTPLSFMRSQVDLALARPRSPDEYREALQGIDGDLERMTGLLATLLALARADTGRLPLEREPLDLVGMIGVLVEQYRPLTDETGITLVDESAPAELVGDGDLLIQVLVNLLDNAVAHTPTGGSIVIGCREDGEWVRLWVSDTGNGIPFEHQSRIFDRFYRVDEGRSREQGGVGLGLSISRAIVEAHGGTITLRSQPGSGTTVELVLPAAKPV